MRRTRWSGSLGGSRVSTDDEPLGTGADREAGRLNSELPMIPVLQTLLDDLDDHVKGEMAVNPEIIAKGDDLDVNILPISARKWHKLDEAVAVVADLKGSTNLGVGKHAASTAAIYEAATGGLCRIFDEFDADFVAIQGDGAVSKLLVKRVGVPRTDHQEPVWAGKAVNYAAKCAQQAGVHEMIVTGSVWDFVEGNDYLAVTCPCRNGPSDTIWSDVTIDKIHEGDGERAGRKLTSQWCDTHGAEYCAAVLAGQTERPEAEAIVTRMAKAQRDNAFRTAQRRIRENRRNIRRGLAMKNR